VRQPLDVVFITVQEVMVVHVPPAEDPECRYQKRFNKIQRFSIETNGKISLCFLSFDNFSQSYSFYNLYSEIYKIYLAACQVFKFDLGVLGAKLQVF